jgi:hypothetical protein
MSQAKDRRHTPGKDRPPDWGQIAVILAALIQVGGRILQDWIGRGGHI